MARTLYQIAGGKRKRIVFLPQAETAPLALFFGQESLAMSLHVRTDGYAAYAWLRRHRSPGRWETWSRSSNMRGSEGDVRGKHT